MRKFLLLVFLVGSLVLFPSCVATLPEFTTSPSFEEWISSLRTWEDLKDFLLGCEYVSDFVQFNRREYVQTPEEFFHNRRGDCEDFAYFTAYVFHRKYWAIETFVVFVSGLYNGKEIRHATAVIRDLGGYFVVDFATMYRRYSTLEEAIKTSFPFQRLRIWAVQEVKSNRSLEPVTLLRELASP
jgi:hypothetical protein